jgi:hypothetical protein
MFNIKFKVFIYILFVLLLILYLYISYKYELKKRQISIKEQFINKIKNSLILKKEQFIQPLNNEFKEEWKNIIIDYVSEFNNINLLARNVKTKDELIQKYNHQCLLYISNDDIKSINTMLSKLNSSNILYPLIKNILPYIRILKCTSILELGFPHTHNNIIIFSEEYFSNPSLTTFIHECIHIDQRLNPNKYNKLYTDWGFVKYSLTDIKGNEFKAEIIPYSRNNPDGRNINWLWISPSNNAYWIGAVFTSDNPSSIADVENRIYKIENINADYNTIKKIGKYKGQTELIHNNKEFVSIFGKIINNNYHPNEIAAELAVNLYNSKNNKSIASKKLLEYI